MMSPAPLRLHFLLFWTRFQLVSEQLWPVLLRFFMVVALWLIAVFSGVFTLLPFPLVWLLWGLWAGAGIWMLLPLRHLSWPDRQQAIARLEAQTQSLQKARPLSSSLDRPFDHNQIHSPLWQAHLNRARTGLSHLCAVPSRQTTVQGDPFALRAPLIIALALSFIALPRPFAEQMRLSWQGAPLASSSYAPARLDSWIVAPDYTGKPPLYLIRDGQQVLEAETLTLPEGSELVLRSSGPSAVQFEYQDQAVRPFEEDKDSYPASSRHPLTGEGSLVLSNSQTGLSLQASLSLLKDHPPAIVWQADPADPAEPPAQRLRLAYKAYDDYGLSEGVAVMVPEKEGFDPHKALLALSDVPLILPETLNKMTAQPAETVKDFSAHPFAGLPVSVRLKVTDAKGQEGWSASRTLLLPARPFQDPVARALLYERQQLALNRDYQALALTAMEGLMLSPELFMTKQPTTYLGLVVVTSRLQRARDDAALKDVLGLLWDLALYVEEGDLSQASKDLQAAREALQEALQRGASSDEIASLTEDLRQAFERYMAELAAQMGEQNRPLPSLPGQKGESLNSDSMRDLMDRIEELARMGSTEAAQALMEQLQAMLDRLQNARPMAGNQQGGTGQNQPNPMMEALNDLSQLLDDQQKLMDETYRREQELYGQEMLDEHYELLEEFARQWQQNQQDQGSAGQTPQASPETTDPSSPQGGQSDSPSDQAPENPFAELQEQQQSLQQNLQALIERLQQQGIPSPSLQDGRKAMNEAEKDLQSGEGEAAVEDQSEALEALRQGAGDLAKALAEAMAQSGGQGGQGATTQLVPGQGQPGFQSGGQKERSAFDPLGRPSAPRRPGENGVQDDGSDTAVPLVSDLQRAREILNSLRERLSETGRPQAELDYLERLLERF
jgi:uncharacterized protein (TIGR02302 family)